MKSRVGDVDFGEVSGLCTVFLHNRRLSTDLVVGANRINSAMKEWYRRLGARISLPTPTGNLAMRLLLKTKDIITNPELMEFVTDPQLDYLVGPDAHAGIFPFPSLMIGASEMIGNYALKGGEQFHMVLLVSDHIPKDDATTIEGNVDERRGIYKDWDPRYSS